MRPGWPTARDGRVWWTEDRPGEGGRTTIVRRAADGTHRDLLPAPWSARTRVHEYGGRPYAVTPEGEVVFANLKDQRLYVLGENGHPKPLTDEGCRYADLLVHDGQVWCVRERHAGNGKVTRAIVSIPLAGGQIRERATGHDFYASPTVSPDGRHLAYVCWNHPRMPWDGTELRVTALSSGGSWTVRGGPAESVLAPAWKDDSRLYLISDSSGWWNLYEIGLHGDGARAVHPAEEEFTLPPWRLGGMPYTVLADGRLAVLHGRGDLRLAGLDPASGALTDLALPYTGWDAALTADGTSVAGIGYTATTPRTVVTVDMGTGEHHALKRDLSTLPDPSYLPTPRPYACPAAAPVRPATRAPPKPVPHPRKTSPQRQKARPRRRATGPRRQRKTRSRLGKTRPQFPEATPRHPAVRSRHPQTPPRRRAAGPRRHR
ncbi:hypothetical protein ACFQYP_37105 [Nonomuraea antimicrobica]